MVDPSKYAKDENGITAEEKSLIMAAEGHLTDAIDILQTLNRKFPKRHYSLTVTNAEQARLWLQSEQMVQWK
jgi:hypothetical protein